MVISRARLGTVLGTALGLSLAGCAYDAGSAVSPAASIATSNRAAAASISAAQLNAFSRISPAAGPNTGTQVASLDPMLASPAAAQEANPPVIQKGTVLWRRMGDEAEAVPTPQVSDELRRLRESLQQVQGQTTEQISSLEERLQTSQKTLAQVREDQQRQERDLRSQTAEAVTNVATMAQQSMRSMENVATNTSSHWTATNQQLNQLEGRLQTAVTDIQQQQNHSAERTQALQLQNEKLSAVQQMQGMQFASLQNATDAKITSAQQLQSVQLAAIQNATDAKITAAQQLQGVQLAAVSNQLAANQQLTAMQLAELRKLSDENRTLASSETLNVAAALRQYADAQLQAAAASNATTIASLAQATDQSVANLSDQTNKRLGLIWQAANANAEKLAEQKANAVAASLAALQQQTAAQKIEPEQIRAIAEKTVADSTPEFRALALKTMQDSQDYIRTVARAAVSDKDPAMQTALADAARDVITKDDKVVFAIRKAVADELSGAPAEDVSGTNPAVRLGPDHARAITSTGETDDLDPNRLRIAQLLAPGTQLPAPDATQVAALSAPAGQPGIGGQQSWSTPGTSLMRSRNRADWMDIRQYKVVVHEDDQTLEDLLGKVLKRAEPFTGPWQVRWKVSDQNREVLQEKFSLDAETTFEEFVSYLAQYVVNDRGIKLSFSLFDNERIIVISD